MRVRMLSDRQGSPDGIRINWYREGQEYELPLSLAQDFIDSGAAIDATAEIALETPKREYAARPKTKTKAS